MKVVQNAKVDDYIEMLQDVISQNIELRLRLNGTTQSEFARALETTQSSISQKLTRARNWTFRDIASAALFFHTTFEGLTSSNALEELRREEEKKLSEEKALEERYRQAQRELAMQFREQKKRIRENVGKSKRTPADVRPRFLVAPVPPVGFEPTTHDLKGRCSNR